MIDLYYWPTPNGHKITLFLEEAGLDYTIKPVNISAGDQFDPKFLAFSPNNRMPAVIDHDPADHGEPVTVFESGAILLYLGEKTGLFLPTDIRGRKTTTEWLFWQMGGLGPMAGQNHHFGVYAPEKIPYAINRYSTRPTGSMGSSIAVWRTVLSWLATPTRSQTWPRIRGSCRGNDSSRTWTTS
jgi:GSH-dependent disulfide-bond oxidoreductase